MNNFEKRLYTYFAFLDKRIGLEHLEIIIRELGKVFQLGIDDFYSEEQRKTVIEKLIEYGNMRKCKEEKACYFLFAFQLNKINEFEINVPVIFLDKTLIVDKVCEKTPESILNIMSERHREQALEAEKEMQPDKEILERFNVQIWTNRFKWNKISETLRNFE